ncbi:hypothetical protein EMCRGX_G016822 [Ephydatia muelleri]
MGQLPPAGCLEEALRAEGAWERAEGPAQILSVELVVPCKNASNEHCSLCFLSLLSDASNSHPIPTLYIITTTYQHDTQKANLVTLCQTLMHVRSLVWIVVENSTYHIPMVQALLKRCGVPYVHLTVPSPNNSLVRPISSAMGIRNHNVGLRWVREHNRCVECNGVIYFGNDDDRYDLRLFDELRKTATISVFMVGLTGGLLMEGPCCQEGRVAKWHHVQAPPSWLQLQPQVTTPTTLFCSALLPPQVDRKQDKKSSLADVSDSASGTGTGTRTSKKDIVRWSLLESLNSVFTETISSSESPSAVASGSKQAPPPPMPSTLPSSSTQDGPVWSVTHGVHLVAMGYHCSPTPAGC